VLISDLHYHAIREKSVQGRYVINDGIHSFFQKASKKFTVEVLGESVQKRPIQVITLGEGGSKTLMWSQMHGNESTTTKAVLDLINFLTENTAYAKNILRHCTIKIVPILNPDGAAVYTRKNANKIDLNRDALDLSQPESRLLRQLYKNFKPDYCFNLHDQRTLFNVGNTPKPATISFLAPAYDEGRSISEKRAISMQLIVAMEKALQPLIPDQIGRYDDAFDPNCVGDTFQMLNTPTILFEAGHFPGDYQREETREHIFYALLAGLKSIATNEIQEYKMEDYFSIPENNKLFFDVLIKNPQVLNPNYKKGETIGILFKEVLEDKSIVFDPYIEATGELSKNFGHKTYNCLDAKDLENLRNNTPVYSLLT